MSSFKIAILADTLELYFLPALGYSDFFVVAPEGSFWLNYVQKIFSDKQVIKVKSSHPMYYYDDIIQKTNLAQELQTRSIKHLVVPHQLTPIIESWARKHDISLIGTPYNLQRRFENKPFFHAWLIKNNIATPHSPSLKELNKKHNDKSIYVIQREIGDSRLYTTKYYHGGASALRAAKNMPSHKFLIREYCEGLSLGVSIFLDKDSNFFYSGLRLQGVAGQRGGLSPSLLGIQWLPTDNFSSDELASINRTLLRLTKALLKEKFFGVANIDFIFKENQALILECNPRFTTSTPQVFFVAALTPASNAWQFYLNTFLNIKNSPIHSSVIPAHNFAGAAMEGEIIFSKNKLSEKSKIFSGVYRFQKDRIKMFPDNPQKIRLKKNYFFAAFESFISGKKGCVELVYNIISNFPLFDFQHGALNASGEKLLHYFETKLR